MADGDSSSNRETELKLAVRPEAMESLRTAPAVSGRGKGRAATHTLEATYYDTPDRDLSARLVSFRVRREDDRFVQTLKSAPDSDGAGLSRGEWEWVVPGPTPDFTLITDAAALAQLDGIDRTALAPVFETHIRRTVRTITHGDTTIEVAFDEGEVRGPTGRTHPVAEVELELKQGDPRALFALARELAAVAPVRVERRTKAARGYALADGTLGGAVKAGRVDLDAACTVEGVLCRIVRNCLEQLGANEDCALAGDDPEGVHQARVALRRLRSALVVFKPFLPPDQTLWLEGEVKWLAGTFGPARDWDVFLTELLAPVKAGFAGAGEHGGEVPQDLETLEAAVQKGRAEAYEAVRAALSSARYGLFTLQVAEWLDTRGWRAQPVSEESIRLLEPIGHLADSLLAQRYRKVRKRGEGFEDLSIADRHKLRIAMKKLRYTADFFRDLYDDKPVRRYIELLGQFQDQLGHLNDVATATRLLHALHADGTSPSVGEARAAGVVIGWLARGTVALEPQLCDAWERFDAAKPFWSKAHRLA